MSFNVTYDKIIIIRGVVKTRLSELNKDPGEGVGKGSLFWPKWIPVCATERGMVCRVFCLKRSEQFHHLVSFPTGSF